MFFGSFAEVSVLEMSMMLIVKAFSLKIGNPLSKLVLIKLADNANDTGECWPSYRHIADQCEIDRSTAIRHIKILEEMGYVRIEKRLGEKGNSSNIFHLNLDQKKLMGGGVAPPGVVAESDQDGGRERLPSGTEPPGGSSTAPPRTSHSFEPVNEPDDLSGKPAGSPPPKPKFEYPEWFETLWKNYPSRSGANDKRKAFRAANARLKAGKTIDDLSQALARYRIYVRQSGKWGTEFVQQAATFFGPGGHIDNEWRYTSETSNPIHRKDTKSFAERQRDQARTAMRNAGIGPGGG